LLNRTAKNDTKVIVGDSTVTCRVVGQCGKVGIRALLYNIIIYILYKLYGEELAHRGAPFVSPTTVSLRSNRKDFEQSKLLSLNLPSLTSWMRVDTFLYLSTNVRMFNLFYPWAGSG